MRHMTVVASLPVRRKEHHEVPELCARVRADREAAELSQEDAARKIGVSLSAYRLYETRREPRPSRLRQIALAFGLPEDHYLGGQEERDEVAQALQALEARQDELVRMMDEITRRLEAWMRSRA